jgi:hypothetical protein
LEQEEIILCIDTDAQVSSLYSVIIGARTLSGGAAAREVSASIGFNPRTLERKLRSAAAVVQTSSNCSSLNGDSRVYCDALVEDVNRLIAVLVEVTRRRNQLAEDISTAWTDRDMEKLDDLRRDRALSCEANNRCPASSPPLDAWIDGKLTEARNGLRAGTRVRMIDGTVQFLDDSALADASGQEPIKGLVKMRTDLGQLLLNVANGIVSLQTLATHIVDSTRRRPRVFRLGSFPGNTLVQATLEQHVMNLAYDERMERISYGPEATRYSLALEVRSTSSYRFSAGIIASSMDQPSADTYLGSAAFATFLWCPQEQVNSIYSRRCASGSDWPQFVPSPTIGIPLSKDVTGNWFVGLDLPYIPFASLLVGAHLGVSDQTFRKAAFAGIGVNSEVLSGLSPTVKPAQ